MLRQQTMHNIRCTSHRDLCSCHLRCTSPHLHYGCCPTSRSVCSSCAVDPNCPGRPSCSGSTSGPDSCCSPNSDSADSSCSSSDSADSCCTSSPDSSSACRPASGTACGPASGFPGHNSCCSTSCPTSGTACGPASGCTSGSDSGSASSPASGAAYGPASGCTSGSDSGSASRPASGTACRPAGGCPSHNSCCRTSHTDLRFCPCCPDSGSTSLAAGSCCTCTSGAICVQPTGECCSHIHINSGCRSTSLHLDLPSHQLVAPGLSISGGLWRLRISGCSSRCPWHTVPGSLLTHLRVTDSVQH